MKSFLKKYQDSIIGAINGFDRLVFRGTIRRISSVCGIVSYMQYHKILCKDFADWSTEITNRIRSASEQVAHDCQRPIHYLNSSSIDKEEYARNIAKKDNVKKGLICLLSAVEPCMTFDLYKNREKKTLDVVARERKCLWLYHYMVHPVLGFMHARIQTWLPFTIKICINGREWLSRQMDEERIGYKRRSNCFIDIENILRAQEFLDTQLKTDWPALLNSIQDMISPAYKTVFANYPMPYYWSADESEWASDIMFKSAAQLEKIYKQLLWHGITVFQSPDVMRFLGHLNEESRSIHGNFKGQVVTSLKERPEGVRIKHWLNNNSVKIYNKEGSVLRAETTINNAREFKVYRQAENKTGKPYEWQKMRKGVADLHRRAHVSQACNNRYLDALSTVETGEIVEQQLQPICRKIQHNGYEYRALNPWSDHDAALLKVICRGEFSINGFRNRNIVEHIYPDAASLKGHDRKRLSAKVSRDLRLFKAHGLIAKVAKTHRYVLTKKGKTITSAFLIVNNSKINSLCQIAA